jgi:hypothetical protein
MKHLKQFVSFLTIVLTDVRKAYFNRHLNRMIGS